MCTDKSALEDFEEFVDMMGYELIYISAATGENIKNLVMKTAEKLSTLPPIVVYESEITEDDTIPVKLSKEITIVKENGVYFVEGEWLYKLMGSINFDDRESLSYFQRSLRSSGIIDKLEEAGVKDGDTVNMYDFEFDFIK